MCGHSDDFAPQRPDHPHNVVAWQKLPSKMVSAHRQQEDDRDRDADEQQNKGSHGRLLVAGAKTMQPSVLIPNTLNWLPI